MRRTTAASVVLLIAVLLPVATAVPASAAGVPAGSAEITVPGQPTALRSGGSGTPFGMALPPGASCPGDSAHHGFHVFSYLVPRGVSPTTVHFTDVPDKGFGLFAGGVYVGALNTAEYSGQVIGLPATLSLSRLDSALLFHGGQTRSTWNVGIACADSKGAVSSYWNAVVTFTAATKHPDGFTWSVTKSVSVAPAGHPGVWIALALLVVAAALAVLSLQLRRRGRQGAASAGDGTVPDDGASAAPPRAPKPAESGAQHAGN